MTRSRTRVAAQQSGFYSRTIQGSTGTWNVDYQDKSTCVDELHKGYPFTTDGPLTIEHFNRQGFQHINSPKPVKQGIATVVAKNVCPDVIRLGVWTHLPTGIPSASVDAAKVLAFTNPNRGEADIGEDLLNPLGAPIRKIKKIGEDLIHNTADAHLWYQFGFDPFIEDLKKILDYQLVMQRRLREMESLFKKGGLRRKISLGTYTANAQNRTVLHSNVIPLTATVKTTTVATRWGVVRWKPLGWHLSDYTSVDLEAKVRRLLYGLDLSPQNLWKLLPWSWLIGWFTNVNLLMQGSKSNFPVIPGNVSICTTTVTTYEITDPSIASGFTGGQGSLSLSTKQRQIVPSAGLPIAFMPLSSFGWGKSSILGSLFVQRFL